MGLKLTEATYRACLCLAMSSINFRGFNDHFLKNKTTDAAFHSPLVSFPRIPERDNLAVTDFQYILLGMVLSTLFWVVPLELPFQQLLKLSFLSSSILCSQSPGELWSAGSTKLDSHRYGRDVRHDLIQYFLCSPCFNSPTKSLPCCHPAHASGPPITVNSLCPKQHWPFLESTN